MFEIHPPLAYAALALIAFTAGFGWTVGCWLAAYLTTDRRRRAA